MNPATTRLHSSKGPVHTRVTLLDVLRGLALFGILLINITVLGGSAFMSPAQASALPGGSADPWVGFALTALVEGKFYCLFSLLFGVGAALMLSRAERHSSVPITILARRYLGLAGIGLLHAILIWHGDILVLYAVLGLVLLGFRNQPPAALLATAVLSLLCPIVLYGLALAFFSAPSVSDSGGLPPSVIRAFQAFAAGSYGDIVQANTLLFALNWVRRLVLMFYPRVFGMFLLGMVLGRLGILQRPARYPRLWRALSLAGLALGLPCSVAYAAIEGPSSPFLLSANGFWRTCAESVGTPLLTLAYVSWIVCAWRLLHWRRWLRYLAPVGQMALTNYLLQSAIGVLLFYGVGGGLFQHLSVTACLAVTLPIYAAQVVYSTLWLTHFNFGPAEWVWRQLTYGRRIPL